MHADTRTAQPIATDEGVTYQPWSNGYAVGFQATYPDGRTEYIYLNPSGQLDEGTAEVCLYQGTTGDPAGDSPRQFFELFEAAGNDAPRSPERAEFLTDMITTAVEGGIGYWSTVSDYRWYSPTVTGGTAAPGPHGTANAHATIHEDHAAPEAGIHIGLDEIDSALHRITTTPVEGISTHQRERLTRAHHANDHTEADLGADDADAVVQVACFGRVIYG